MRDNLVNKSLGTQLFGKILIAIVVYLFLNKFSLEINIDNVIKSAFISIIITEISKSVFNRWLWRTGAVRSILSIKKPYVQGRWNGYIRSSYDNFHTKFPIIIEIHQTYISTHLTYYDERAISRGVVTAFIVEEGASPKLYCIYRNEPIVATKKGLQMHYGTMILTVTNGGAKIKGVYFNYYLQRSTYGELFIELESRKLTHGF